jgi:hypothetical protein
MGREGLELRKMSTKDNSERVQFVVHHTDLYKRSQSLLGGKDDALRTGIFFASI